MYSALEKIIYQFYGLKLSIIDNDDNVYILASINRKFVLKKTLSLQEEVLNLKLPYFVSIIPTIQQQLYFVYQNEYYFLMNYVDLSDQRVTNALKSLGSIHRDTFFVKKVSKEFYAFEITRLEEKLSQSFSFFDQLMDGLLEEEVYHPGLWALVELYPTIQQLKKRAYELLDDYKKSIATKDTCRFCLAFKDLNLSHYSNSQQCWIAPDRVVFDIVGRDFLSLLYTSLEYENIEIFYLTQFSFTDDEKKWILLQLFCLDTWDFYQDGWSTIRYLWSLKHWLIKLNKIMNSLQFS